MSYSKLLKKIAVESGYTSTQIIEQCKLNGVKIDKAYFSRILNGKTPPPSEEYSRMFAKVCGADERLLVLEGYFDKAPKEVRNCINTIRKVIVSLGMNCFNNLSNEDIKIMQNLIDDEPLTDFILAILDMDINNLDLGVSLSDINNSTIDILEPVGIQIQDNAMFPLISENSQIILKVEKEYKDGDIVAIKLKEYKKPIVRYILYKNKDVILTSINKEFETLEYKAKDIEILGKVSKVINEVQ